MRAGHGDRGPARAERDDETTDSALPFDTFPSLLNLKMDPNGCGRSRHRRRSIPTPRLSQSTYPDSREVPEARRIDRQPAAILAARATDVVVMTTGSFLTPNRSRHPLSGTARGAIQGNGKKLVVYSLRPDIEHPELGKCIGTTICGRVGVVKCQEPPIFHILSSRKDRQNPCRARRHAPERADVPDEPRFGCEWRSLSLID